MNIKLLKNQLTHELYSWKSILIIIVTIGLIVVEFMTTNIWSGLSQNFLHYTLLFDIFSRAGSIYLILIPFIAALLGGTLYSSELHSKRLTLLQPRIVRKSFIRTTFVSSFILGGIASIFPIVISLIVAFVKLPHFFASTPNKDYPIFAAGFWGSSFYTTHPRLMILLIVALLFIFGGLIANLATVISFKSQLKYIEILIPFVGLFVWYLLVSILGMPALAHIVFLNFPASSSFSHAGLYMLAVFLVIAGFNLIMLLKEEQHDDFT